MRHATRLASAILLLGLWGGSSAQGEPLDVHLVLRGSHAGQERPVPVRVQAVPSSTAPGQAQAEPIEARGEVPGPVRLDLPPSQVWQIAVEADGYWSRPVMTAGSSSDPAGVDLDLWPLGTLSGSIQVPPGQKDPSELTVRFRTSPRPGKADPLGEHSVTCPIADRRWTCRIPEGNLDLRLRARGFVSHFRWGVGVKGGETLPIGLLSLQPGASVVGRVEAEDAAVSPKDCRVELAPMISGMGRAQEDEKERRAGLTLSATVNERGFFHFEGVKPGSYRLTAQQPGLAPAEIYPVSVLETSESEVRQPLVLRRAVPLEVRLDPPVDPWNRRWQVGIFGRSPVPGSTIALGKTVANEQGRLVKEGLAPGDYEIEVQDGNGSSYAWQEVRLERGTAPVEIRLPLVWVEGTVELGEDPLEANLWFGGRNGRVSVLLRAGRDGEFAGVLPREGEWDIDVDASSPKVERRLLKVAVKPLPEATSARLTLRIPATRISGEVLDEKGDRVPKARVMAMDPQTLDPSFVESDEEGRFELEGLSEGLVTLIADKAGAKSSELAVDLSEGNSLPPVKLVLRKLRELNGVILAQGSGLPGVKVLVMAPDRNNPAALPTSVQALTDVEGRFRVNVPGGATDLLLMAMPAGFDFIAQRWDRLPSEPLQLNATSVGGRLTIVPGDSGDNSDPETERVMVTVNGVFLDSILLGAWSSLQGEPNPGPQRLSAPHLPPGRYTVCWMSTGEAWAAFRVGAFPATATCSDGTLPAGGELVLERPRDRP